MVQHAAKSDVEGRLHEGPERAVGDPRQAEHGHDGGWMRRRPHAAQAVAAENVRYAQGVGHHLRGEAQPRGDDDVRVVLGRKQVFDLPGQMPAQQPNLPGQRDDRVLFGHGPVAQQYGVHVLTDRDEAEAARFDRSAEIRRRRDRHRVTAPCELGSEHQLRLHVAARAERREQHLHSTSVSTGRWLMLGESMSVATAWRATSSSCQ